MAKVLVTGIARPKPFIAQLKTDGDIVLEFPDHHNFSDRDISNILAKAGDRPVVTTEKDFVRLTGKIPAQQLFYLPIRTHFVDHAEDFDAHINSYLRNFKPASKGFGK